MIALCAQAVLTFAVDGEGPVRFGFPVPAGALERGLHLRGGGKAARMQWTVLQRHPGFDTGRIWVEVAAVGVRGRATLALGGDPPAPPDGGPVVRTESAERRDEDRVTTTTVRRWADGTVDRVERVVLLADDGAREAGEAWVDDQGLAAARRARVRIRASAWRDVGVLPRADGSGTAWRDALVGTVPLLPAAPGARGRGDFVRGSDPATVTNLEFDTALGLLRLGLAVEDPALLARAHDAARHLVDVDLDARSGLPFRHGRDHRAAPPELGHVWVEGLLLTGCVFADRELIDHALQIGRALAARLRGAPEAAGRLDRLRDEAWPLRELEVLLRFADLPPLRAAADALGARILDRWDPTFESLRYGEAETRNPDVRKDRLWLSLGIAVPALERFAERTGDDRAAAVVRALRTRALAALLDGRDGVPLQLALGPTGPFDAVRVEGAAEALLLLDGLDPRGRRQALARSAVRRALEGALDSGHDDLATRFSIVARCGWVMQ